ncbi:MAG: peptide chain release factor H [Bacteroidia bacterium]|nr:peptide chain release factor H [Bacteroidia bacterium]
METKILQLTSGKGPAECCLAVALALRELLREASVAGINAEVLARHSAQEKGTLQSATVKLIGKHLDLFSSNWCGVLLWTAQSPYRKFHKRKNWFIGIYEINQAQLPEWHEKDIVFQTMRSSGPGGQNVNKTETAVRATHKASGLSVTASDSRSQLQNKNLAIQRLKEKLMQWQQNQLCEQGYKDPWQNHLELERGNPNRSYRGREFRKN